MPAVSQPRIPALPYLRRKPPGLDGWEKTGLPAMRSWRNFWLASPPVFLLPARLSSQSQPSILSLVTCFFSLGLFRAMPSAATRAIPPLTLLVSILGRSLYPDTSSSSVGSPSMHMGQFLTMVLTIV